MFNILKPVRKCFWFIHALSLIFLLATCKDCTKQKDPKGRQRTQGPQWAQGLQLTLLLKTLLSTLLVFFFFVFCSCHWSHKEKNLKYFQCLYYNLLITCIQSECSIAENTFCCWHYHSVIIIMSFIKCINTNIMFYRLCKGIANYVFTFWNV